MSRPFCGSLDYIPKHNTKSKSKKQKSRSAGSLYNVSKADCKQEKYLLGDVWLGKTNNVLPPEWTTCRAEVRHQDPEDKLILHFDVATVVITIADFQFLKDLFLIRLFNFDFKLDEENAIASLYLAKLPLPKFTNKIGSIMKSVFSLTLNLCSEYNEIDTVKSSFIVEHCNILYKNVAALQNDILHVDLYHSQLKPTLRPYQQSAVMWMLNREKLMGRDKVQHPLYDKVTLQNGVELYFDKYTGYIELTKPICRSDQPGGILADEMGLGKTVEILALILLNSKSNRIIIDKCETKTNEILKVMEQTENNSISSSLLSNDKSNGNLDRINENDLDVTGEETDDIDVSMTKKDLNENKGNECGTFDNLQGPTVVTTSRKRKSRKSAQNINDTHIIKEKKQKFVSQGGKKSNLRVALENWYIKMLNPSKQIEPKGIQCICGEFHEDDSVECSQCQKVQHASCLGYERKYGEYICPQCWMYQPLIEATATLIITPTILKQQWCDEICKHIRGNLKVLQYGSGSNVKVIYPQALTEYDVVITTYSILQSELRLSESGQTVSLRRPPKYSLPGSPITLVNWWRLCLDEAQTVETPGRMVSIMAKKIHAQHRWAVTGTPISKDISDLYGLIDYLQMSPYCELETWDNILYKPYINGRKENMHTFLSKILWRTAKNDVLDQINIPKQTVEEYWVEFTAIEKFFYDREHELSSTEFLEKLKNVDLNIPLKLLNKSVLKKITSPLLALRQACVHHQTVKGRYLATRKQVSSMEDLLDALIAKNLAQCEEYLRTMVSAMNGLASIHLLQQHPLEAAEMYRKVLNLAEKYAKKEGEAPLDIDKLQQIHAICNLTEILELYPGIPRTLEDAPLKERWMRLENEYLDKFMKQLIAVMTEKSKHQQITELQSKFVLAPGQWFADALDWITTNNYFNEYCQKLMMHAVNADIIIKCTSERAVMFKIATWDEKIMELKQITFDSINELLEYDDELNTYKVPLEIITTAADCHLRPDTASKGRKAEKKKKSCLLCIADAHLKEYESVLFSSEQKVDDVANSGSWKPSSEEFMIKALYTLAKSQKASSDLVHDGEIHLHILELLRKEFKDIRKQWTYIHEIVCAKDELDMCRIRLQIKQKPDKSKEETSLQKNRALKALSNEIDNKLLDIHFLEEAEIPYQLAHLSSQERSSLKMLEANFCTYKYLQTLYNQQTKAEDPEPCPICKCVLDKQWNILTCGHCYCIDCIKILIGRQSRIRHRQFINCPVCRKSVNVSDISYLCKEGKKVEDDAAIKGNCSSKVEAVLKLILKLKQEDSDVKILVFSNWFALLKLMQPIFSLNNVKSELLYRHQFEKTLSSFKDSKKGITALLLPVSLGSKGLNLIEATHVIFVEPLLNPGDELQAIGRVHRIGQTRPTIVHKFFMKNTIEESIYHTVLTKTEEWDANRVTLGQMKKLFEYDNFNINFDETDGAMEVDNNDDAANQDPGGNLPEDNSEDNRALDNY